LLVLVIASDTFVTTYPTFGLAALWTGIDAIAGLATMARARSLRLIGRNRWHVASLDQVHHRTRLDSELTLKRKPGRSLVVSAIHEFLCSIK
jgi:hypothetical protein